MSYKQTQSKEISGTVKDLDYLAWAMATVRLEQSREYVSPQFAPAEWRSRAIASAVRRMKGFRKLELLPLVLLAAQMNADCRLIAKPGAPKLHARVTYIGQAARLTASDGILPNVRCVGSWLDSVRNQMPIDEVAWGAQMGQRTVMSLLHGHKTRIDLIARALDAMGYKLKFWFCYDGCAVGDPEFCRRFPYASQSHYRRSVRKMTREQVRNADFLRLLVSDIA
jgi:hypothetical protein